MADTYPIPAEALDDRLAFVGTTGSGKTYAAGTAVERLIKSRARVVIIDPLDVWWGLRLAPDGKSAGFKVVIFGGAHGDLPLNEQAGALIGETVASMAESCIVSLGGMASKSAERRFMLAFLDAIYRKADPAKYGPFHMVFDEADLFAPQKALEPMLQARMEEIVRRGRIKGFTPWLITQRPAVLSKDVLSQADGLIALKLTASQDRDAIGAWIEGMADRAQGREILGSLPAMQRGEGVIWIPGRGVLKTAAFPTKATFDSSRTPKRGETMARPDLKPLDLGALKDRLASLDAEAKSSDPRALKAEIARLTRDLAKAQREIAAPPAPVTITANPDEIEAARKEGERVGIGIGIAQAQEALRALRVDSSPAVSTGARRATPAPKLAESHAPLAREPRQSEGDVPPGCAKPLASLAGVYPAGMTEAQWATAAGYKRSGGTWGTYKSRLRGAGLIEQKEGRWFATEAGAAAAGDVELPPAPGPDLVRWWASRLPGTSKIAEALIEAWPRDLGRDELALAVNMSAAGGSFGTYLSRLASPGLIERDGGVIRLSTEAMGQRP